MQDLIRKFSDRCDLISVSDVPLLREIFNKVERHSWAYFAPYLACYSLPPSRPLYLLKKGDNFYILQYLSREHSNRVDLMLPPAILTSVIKSDLLQMKEYLDQPDIRILWVDSYDVDGLKKIFGKDIDIREKEKEYMYDPKIVFGLEGKEFKDVRKRINRIAAQNPVFFPLEKNDLPVAEELLSKWRSTQGKKNRFLFDWGYTRAAIHSVEVFNARDMSAWGLELDKKLVGFSMAGPINRNTACFFVAKTSIGITGVSEYLRWRTFGMLRDYNLVNDASDLGIAGLRQHKLKFRPCGLKPVYTATV